MRVRHTETHEIDLDKIYSLVNLKCSRRKALRYIRHEAELLISMYMPHYYETNPFSGRYMEDDIAKQLVDEELAEFKT